MLLPWHAVVLSTVNESFLAENLWPSLTIPGGPTMLTTMDQLQIGTDMLRFRNLFGNNKCLVIGMIHVGALPGDFFITYSTVGLLYVTFRMFSPQNSSNSEGNVIPVE
jgi:hypothetical protein